MHIQVSLHGLEMAKARLAEVSRKVEPVARGALNTTATKVRAERYVKPLMGSMGRRAWLNAKIKVKRANSRRFESRLIPSSSGVDVSNYKSWGYDTISPTRARIWVRGPRGQKVAAGFVNPRGDLRRPLSTRSERARNLKRPGRNRSPHVRSYRYEMGLTNAMAPSVAFWFKQLTSTQTIRWTNTFLQQEFERRIKREVAKGAR